jgi:hypothetical protein
MLKTSLLSSVYNYIPLTNGSVCVAEVVAEGEVEAAVFELEVVVEREVITVEVEAAVVKREVVAEGEVEAAVFALKVVEAIEPEVVEVVEPEVIVIDYLLVKTNVLLEELVVVSLGHGGSGGHHQRHHRHQRRQQHHFLHLLFSLSRSR